MSVDMGAYIAPKSDQLNADDLIAGPRTITITAVRANESSGEQPISISFEGDNGKPYKPCKSMRRVMVAIWGTNAAAYIGRSMTLYRDENVQFGGMQVGGIRISHMSHIRGPQTVALTATRARRAPYTVQPLETPPARKSEPAAPAIAAPTVDEYAACADRAAFDALERRRADAWKSLKAADKAALKAAADGAKERLEAPAAAAAQPLALSGEPVDAEASAIAALEAAFRNGPDALQAEIDRLEAAYAARNQPIPLAVDAKIGELNEALKE